MTPKQLEPRDQEREAYLEKRNWKPQSPEATESGSSGICPNSPRPAEQAVGVDDCKQGRLRDCNLGEGDCWLLSKEGKTTEADDGIRLKGRETSMGESSQIV